MANNYCVELAKNGKPERQFTPSQNVKKWQKNFLKKK